MSPHTRLHTAKMRLEAVIDRAKLTELSPLERAETLSLLLVELQRRIGLNLMTLLDKESERHFKILMEREADSDEVAAFFSIRIPDYRERVEGVLESFCNECRASLKQLSTVSV